MMEQLHSKHRGADGITVGEYAQMKCIPYSTARNRLENLVCAGKLKKKMRYVSMEPIYKSDWFHNGYTRYMACYQIAGQ